STQGSFTKASLLRATSMKVSHASSGNTAFGRSTKPSAVRRKDYQLLAINNQLMHNKLIIALDVESAIEAREWFNRLRGHVGMFKVGAQLFTAAGPAIVREIIQAGGRVFLDLKFHDIPNTVDR